MHPHTLPLRILIGWDTQQSVAYDVCKFSIERRTSIPVDIRPIKLHEVGSIFTRERGPAESTEFSITRFLTPFLFPGVGPTLFMDSDMVCLADIAELLPLINPLKRGLWCCQHDYTPSTTTKFLNQPQSIYPRKNWSSFMVFTQHTECDHFFGLTPEYVNTAPGLSLHRFEWIDNRDIYPLPLEWNWLVGEYSNNPAAKILHYTLGTPCLPGFEDGPCSSVWHAENAAMVEAHCRNRDTPAQYGEQISRSDRAKTGISSPARLAIHSERFIRKLHEG
jgi:hypothetical protein